MHALALVCFVMVGIPLPPSLTLPLAPIGQLQDAYERLDAREQRTRQQEAELADAKQAAKVRLGWQQAGRQGACCDPEKTCRQRARGQVSDGQSIHHADSEAPRCQTR